jgi:hypothetical protein
MFVRVLPRPASAAIFALLTGSAGKTEQARLTEAEWARHALQELVVQTSSHGLRERCRRLDQFIGIEAKRSVME